MPYSFHLFNSDTVVIVIDLTIIVNSSHRQTVDQYFQLFSLLSVHMFKTRYIPLLRIFLVLEMFIHIPHFQF